MAFRVENKEGKGPYAAQGMFDNWGYGGCKNDSLDRDVYSQDEPNNGNPFPCLDGMGKRAFHGGVMGFASLQSLANWFYNKGMRDGMKRNGFHVVEYRAVRVQKGKHQVLFIKGEKVRSVPWEAVPVPRDVRDWDKEWDGHG